MLTLQDITVRLGGNLILDQVSAALPSKSRVGLVGRNGAGKSTLIKVMAGELEPDGGSFQYPKRTRIGYVAQHTPGGSQSPIDKVLASDTERMSLLHDAENSVDPNRIAEIHDRLTTIDAHGAPARAARVLAGLGFDEDAQNRPLDSFSGGWRMRVALGALLFSEPDLLLLDEPSNHLDLEAELWLESFLKSYPASLVIISHERELLNSVVDHILHVQGGKATLYPGNYDAFERLRRERQAQVEVMRLKQESKRKELQAYVDRWRYKTHTARQAQSRIKALERMEPIAAAAEDPSLTFDFPSPDELRPPLITLNDAEVGYVADTPVLSQLDLRIDPDDRIALVGRNGNGKTTLARLLAGQLGPSQGGIQHSSKVRVGYFAQHQIEDLVIDETPFQHMTRMLPDAKPGAVRSQLGRFGFSGDMANREVGQLSGGERARLALALITRDAPHILLLDEPTNHLDVDAREALVQALAEFSGAVIIVSHDRHLLELTADRLVLVADGMAKEFNGTLDDYQDLVMGRVSEKRTGTTEKKPANKKEQRRITAEKRNQNKILRKAVSETETNMNRLTERRTAIDQALFKPAEATGEFQDIATSDLMKLRADVERALVKAESKWLKASEALEQAEAAVG
ncbi:MAG: ABC-F family ATP-binding cassette domain-containing protein [Rhodospirillaceae bacterium]|jgi:ATP-binding cassette, subfamily F, member 3|nr:ABC-F family ATP-binding cassette domain-containing protein [Rhodospirillaceae bacterium]